MSGFLWIYVFVSLSFIPYDMDKNRLLRRQILLNFYCTMPKGKIIFSINK